MSRGPATSAAASSSSRSEEHTSELQSHSELVCRLLLETKKATAIVERCHLGYYLRAIKDEHDAESSVGINIARYKQVALSLSFFFNDTATTEIYTLSLHDALPI